MSEKSILITGCSSGIGYETAVILRDRGYRVFTSARKAEDVLRLKQQGFESLQLDLNDNDSIETAVAEVANRTGGNLYALFNNAGFMQVGAVEDLTREVIRAQFETNVFGPVELTRHILPLMRKQGYGRIIQNSSILGLITMPFYGAYNASKFALEAFSMTLRQELHNTNIYVSIINPGPIKTALRKNAFRYYSQAIPKQGSLYRRIYSKLESTYFNKPNKTTALAPSAVTKKVIAALESNSPAPHYYVGVRTAVLAHARDFLPERFLDWIVGKITSIKPS